MEILERWTERSGTHGEITKLAIKLLREPEIGFDIEGKFKDDSYLIASSDDPDEQPVDFWVGHFYGTLENGNKGSYIPLNIGGLELNALNNFVQWFTETLKLTELKEKAIDTGNTLHYIQDITAPHHFHNLPAFTSRCLYGWDTHGEFEKKAKKRIIGANNYLQEANVIFKQLSFTNPKDFASEINKRALAIVPNKDALKEDLNWKAIIDQLLPLAIAASAKVIEKI